MKIHTVKSGETLYGIAKAHGTTYTSLAEINGLKKPDRLTVGKELLILTPTRTYTTAPNDTLERISRRFGLTKTELLKNNPSLLGSEKLHTGMTLSLKYDTPAKGSAIAHGYAFGACSKERLSLFLPFLSYASIGAYRTESGRIVRGFDDSETVKRCKDSGCAPLMRIYDTRDANTAEKESARFIEQIKEIAKKSGYNGVTLGAYGYSRDERYESLICYYRDSLHRDGLILFCEADANGKVGYENESDGCILCYEKAQLENPPSFSEGEAAALDDYAKGCEARQAFIDLSPFAYVNGRQIGKNEAEEFALNKGQDIITDEKRGICRILCGGKGENAVFESMKNTKAKLELISELGFRGVSFDIMRTPIYDLMMAAASFYLGTDYFSSSLPM